MCLISSAFEVEAGGARFRIEVRRPPRFAKPRSRKAKAGGAQTHGAGNVSYESHGIRRANRPRYCNSLSSGICVEVGEAQGIAWSSCKAKEGGMSHGVEALRTAPNNAVKAIVAAPLIRTPSTSRLLGHGFGIVARASARY